MAALKTSNVTGSIQKYFEKRMMGLPLSSFDTVLANAEVGIAGNTNIPGHAGQVAEFRHFAHFDPPATTAGTDDSPKTYAESAEPSAGESLTATVYRLPLTELSAYIELGNILTATDPIDLMQRAFDSFMIQVKRYVHRVVNENLVNGVTDDNTFTSDWASTRLPPGCQAMYAGGIGNFSDLAEDSFITMRDIARAVAIADNSPKERFRYPDGFYRCVIDHAIKNHFIQNDIRFGDFVKRHEDTAKTVLERNMLPPWNGVKFLIQDDPYRCNLPVASGDPNTRVDTGAVHCAHFLGHGCFGYVDLAGKSRLKPKFKVQDITITGYNTTIGYRIPFQSGPIRPKLGINIFGTTEFSEDIDDLGVAA